MMPVNKTTKTPQLSFTSNSLITSKKLHNILNKLLISQPALLEASSLTINFRDKSYSSESGGYHPVEVGLHKTESNWLIQYITDFAYFGSYYPELDRNVDFDISKGTAFISGMGWIDINRRDIKDFYRTWESNFLSYLDMDCFDEIEVSCF